MNKMQKKRTESTAQQRFADMMNNFKTNSGENYVSANSPLVDTLIGTATNSRGAQSQSPNTQQKIEGMNTVNTDSNSVNIFRFNTTNQGPTFFMADRMRR